MTLHCHCNLESRSFYGTQSLVPTLTSVTCMRQCPTNYPAKNSLWCSYRPQTGRYNAITMKRTYFYLQDNKRLNVVFCSMVQNKHQYLFNHNIKRP